MKIFENTKLDNIEVYMKCIINKNIKQYFQRYLSKVAYAILEMFLKNRLSSF